MKSITLETAKVDRLELTEDEIKNTLAYFQERVIYFQKLLDMIASQEVEKVTIASDKVLAPYDPAEDDS